MMKFSVYQRENKVRLLNQFREDFKHDFNIDPGHGKGFTRSEYFHFGAIGNRKYVHKESMRFMLTNGESYYVGVEALELFKVNPDQSEKEKIEKNIERIFNFFRNDINNYKIYPNLLEETEHFFVFEFYELEEWEELESLNLKDAKRITEALLPIYKKNKEIVTPFYNQMNLKFLRNKKTGEIKCRDIKSLEFRPASPLGILFYNGYINTYYQLERRFRSREYILRDFAIDYPVKSTKVVKLY